MKVGLIGCGFMGEAMLSAMLSKGVVSASDVFVAEINDDRCAAVHGGYGVTATNDLVPVVDQSELVIFAVKPQEFGRTAHRIEGRFRREQTIMSIMAGVPIRRIATALTHAAIVRVMPNTPAARTLVFAGRSSVRSKRRMSAHASWGHNARIWWRDGRYRGVADHQPRVHAPDCCDLRPGDSELV